MAGFCNVGADAGNLTVIEGAEVQTTFKIGDRRESITVAAGTFAGVGPGRGGGYRVGYPAGFIIGTTVTTVRTLDGQCQFPL